MEIESDKINEKLTKLARDIEIIKKLLLIKSVDEEGELSDWAKSELANSRKDTNRISHAEVKRKVFAR